MLLVLGVACGDHEPVISGGAGGEAGSMAGSAGAGDAGGTAGDDSQGGAAGDGEAGSASAIPFCAVLVVLEDKCQRCHRMPPEFGAPFPLLTYEDTQRVEPPDGGAEVYRKMRPVIETEFMPPLWITDVEPPVEPLTDDERDLLLDWIADGAMEGAEDACDGSGGQGGSGG
jgi:uncharacterized membrane protein